MANDHAIPAKALIRLRDDYRRQSNQFSAQARSLQGNERRFAEQLANTHHAHAQDLDDLLQGKEHPSGRRG